MIIFKNLKLGRIGCYKDFKITLKNDEERFCYIEIRGLIQEKTDYTIQYNWKDNIIPEGVKEKIELPVDNKKYTSAEEAIAALDTKYTDKTSFEGTKNGKVGSWVFSGWSTNIEDAVVTCTGSWAYIEHKISVVYD